MYIPNAFSVDDPAVIGGFMDAHPFALLVSGGGGMPEAVHLPIIRLDEQTLYGHMARANPLWRLWASSPGVLVVFSGPHGYVSPRWYASENNVPTWNYAAVHVAGAAAILENEAHLPLMDRLVAAFEGPDGWRMDPDDPGLSNMLRGTVGFTIAIESVQAKFKMNQNKSEADALGAMASLAASSRCGDREIAQFMKDLYSRV